MIIKRIEPVSVAKVAAILYGGVGAIAGVAVCLAMFAGDLWGGRPCRDAAAGIAAVVLLPVLYAAVGFVFTVLAAALFNFATRMVGGVEIDVD